MPGEGLRPQQEELPAPELLEDAEGRPQQGPVGRAPLEHRGALLAPGPEETGVDSERNDPVVAREPLGRRCRDLGRDRGEGVDPAQQAPPLRAAGRVAEPLGREEGCHRQLGRVSKGQVGEARQARLEAVDDVEPAAA